MKRISVTLGFVFLLAATAGARMGADMPMQGKPMGGTEMADVVGPELMAACHGDLDQLGLSPEVAKAIADKHFELKKKIIRGVADLRVQRLELGKLLEAKGFDLAAAKQKVAEITAKEGELRSLHLDFLAELRSSLTDEQWLKLRKAGESKGMMMQKGAGKGDMMPCMQGDGKQPPKTKGKATHTKRPGRQREMQHGK
ncbi:MAG: periplasmic heavy metal sensor [Syntrophobacteraceae bacterium]|nr:periplasmic heavy metal sensor [Syntrophobacteraceae bacterium]